EADGGSNGCKKENGRLPEEKEEESAPEAPSEDVRPPETTSESEPTEEEEPEPSSDPGGLSAPPPRVLTRPDGGPEPVSGATTDSDSKALSSGESSEDEGYLKGAPETACGSPSILPSSVLDKASAIAQHFAGSVKHGVLATDDIRSPSCESPRLPRSGGGEGVLVLGAEPRETRLNSDCDNRDSDSAFGATDVAPMSPRGLRRRRNSSLSPRDQLLIGKIRMYYENAESEDAAFSVQRRESLTYIPAGLVRSSVSRINSVPSDEPGPAHPAVSAPCHGPGTRGHGVSGAPDPGGAEGLPRSRSRRSQDEPPEDEEFRPSSEMIGIWQTMEAEITGRTPGDVATETASKGREGGASELGTIAEESSNPAPGKIRASGTSRTRSRRQDDGVRTSPHVSQNQNYG
ncbi:pleckstrin homology domain-containing family G member 3-like, partial [Etheostoma cragini]|uniref:pleckstrin homology domain-containing family G member 3-like n=1 Tax=Etheostoma cragini TaxID=417921 RepID=UPI00155E15A6